MSAHLHATTETQCDPAINVTVLARLRTHHIVLKSTLSIEHIFQTQNNSFRLTTQISRGKCHCHAHIAHSQWWPRISLSHTQGPHNSLIYFSISSKWNHFDVITSKCHHHAMFPNLGTDDCLPFYSQQIATQRSTMCTWSSLNGLVTIFLVMHTISKLYAC